MFRYANRNEQGYKMKKENYSKGSMYPLNNGKKNEYKCFIILLSESYKQGHIVSKVKIPK